MGFLLGIGPIQSKHSNSPSSIQLLIVVRCGTNYRSYWCADF